MYTYDVADCLTSVDGVAHTWDARGNQTSDGTLTYTYDTTNRLVEVSSGGLVILRFFLPYWVFPPLVKRNYPDKALWVG